MTAFRERYEILDNIALELAPLVACRDDGSWGEDVHPYYLHR